jgi:type VI secretion system protein ImpB
MDGKSGAEELMNKLLQDPALMKALAAAPKPQPTQTTAPEETRTGGTETPANQAMKEE